MKKLSVCTMLLIAAVGCGKSETTPGTAGTGAAPTQTGMQNNVAQADPTAKPIVTNAAGTQPGEVVALFLDSLRRGDENAANGVLTAQAQTELAKTDFVIQPLGTPEGTYKIGRVGFPDPNDKTVALVECLWSEPNPEAGKAAIELDIVCETRQEANGWRISGLAVTMSGTEDTLVLDFEDAASLQQALIQANQPAQPAPQQTPSAAGVVASQGSLPPGGLPTATMPAGNVAPAGTFPPSNFPPSNLPPTNLPPAGAPNNGTQIALPQLPSNQPINR